MHGNGEINIGGKVRPIRFGINTGILICEMLKISLAEYQQRFTVEGLKTGNGREMRLLIYAGLFCGYESKGEKIPEEITERQVGYWMDEIAPGELDKAFGIIVSGNPENEKSEEKKTNIQNP